jgi:hypothetical protein
MIINKHHDRLIKCKSKTNISDYLEKNDFEIYRRLSIFGAPIEKYTHIPQYEKSNGVHNIKVKKLLEYLKGDKEWINNDIIYNDIVDDMNAVFEIARSNLAAEFQSKCKYMLRLLHDIYCEPSADEVDSIIVLKILELIYINY